MAVNCWVAPTVITRLTGVTDIETRAAGVPPFPHVVRDIAKKARKNTAETNLKFFRKLPISANPASRPARVSARRSSTQARPPASIFAPAPAQATPRSPASARDTKRKPTQLRRPVRHRQRQLRPFDRTLARSSASARRPRAPPPRRTQPILLRHFDEQAAPRRARLRLSTFPPAALALRLPSAPRLKPSRRSPLAGSILDPQRARASSVISKANAGAPLAATLSPEGADAATAEAGLGALCGVGPDFANATSPPPGRQTQRDAAAPTPPATPRARRFFVQYGSNGPRPPAAVPSFMPISHARFGPLSRLG